MSSGCVPSMRQRDLANLRERRRMMLINRGFELLKSRLPLIRELARDARSLKLSKYDDDDANKLKTSSLTRQRLTKVDILRLSIEYIKHLRSILDGNVVQLAGCLQISRTSVYGQVDWLKMSRSHRASAEGGKRQRRVPRPTRATATRLHRKSKSAHESSSTKNLRPASYNDNKVNRSDRSVKVENQTFQRGAKVGLRCAAGASYWLSWSRRQETASFFWDERATTIDGAKCGSVDAPQPDKRIMRDTKLWVPNRE